jgi:hypothetical protein
MTSVFSKPQSRLMRCLLVIATWQAPLPVCHSHGTLATAPAENATWLAEHLWSHHAAINPLADLILGWHLHFAFPDAQDERPDSPKTPRQPSAVGDALTSWDAFARLQVPSGPLMSHAAHVGPNASCLHRPLDGLRLPSGFFANFAPEMPLPVRLGGLRC